MNVAPTMLFRKCVLGKDKSLHELDIPREECWPREPRSVHVNLVGRYVVYVRL